MRGAQAVAAAVFLARRGATKDELREEIERRFAYDLSASLDEIRPGYGFELHCAKSVPEAITCFLESRSYEDAVRNAVSLGGDADTLAAIAGSIAEPFYGGVPDSIVRSCRQMLPAELAEVLDRFATTFVAPVGSGDAEDDARS